MELPGIEPDCLTRLLGDKQQFRYGSFRFLPAHDQRFQFRVLTASSRFVGTPAPESPARSDDRCTTVSSYLPAAAIPSSSLWRSMTTPSLGRLRTVAPRDVWPHEALNFTPWLLSNVDVLSDLLGMDLELQEAEHPVGGFSLDLLGRDLSYDSVVIIENQLEQSGTCQPE